MTTANFPNHWITAELVGAPPYLQRAAKDYAEAYALAALAQSGEPEAQPARVVDALRERLAQETGDDDDFASGLRSGLRIALDLLSTPTAAPTPSQAAVTELETALRRLESAVDWFVGRSASTQTQHLKGMQHSENTRKELYAAHDAARAALAAFEAKKAGA